MLSGCFHFQKKKNMRLKNYSLFGSALLFSMFSVADVCEFEVPATENYSEAAYFYPCDADSPLPAITLTGGYSNTYHKLQWMAEAVAESGYVVLAMTPIDKYGKVEQWRDAHLSGQKTLVATTKDANSPVKNLIDVNLRGITGFSMGGGGTLLAGSILQDDVKALAAFAPFLLKEQRNVSPSAPTMILAGAKDLQVKVKRTAEGIFAVRTRSLESEVSKKKGKNQSKTPPTGKPKTRSEKRKLREKQRVEKRPSV